MGAVLLPGTARLVAAPICRPRMVSPSYFGFLLEVTSENGPTRFGSGSNWRSTTPGESRSAAGAGAASTVDAHMNA